MMGQHHRGSPSVGSTSCISCVPASMRRWPNAGSMFSHRLRRWPNIEPALFAAGVGHLDDDIPKSTRRRANVVLMLASVADDGPTLKQHRLNVSCLLGILPQQTQDLTLIQRYVKPTLFQRLVSAGAVPVPPISRSTPMRIHRKHEHLPQCCFNVGPASKAVTQH